MIRKALDYMDPDKRVRVEPNTRVDEHGNPHQCHVQQHMKDHCDINNILRKYDRDGILTHVNRTQAMYGDYTQINEYQHALDLVLQAQAMFDELPSHLRKRFGNDPGAYAEFVTDPRNLDEMIKLGLAEPVENASAAPITPSAESEATRPSDAQ